jgi:beta-glucanase (GH16 family)
MGAMNWMDRRLAWRLAGMLGVIIVCLAVASGARAQGCSGVAPSVTGGVTWTPQWCQEFNATVAGPPDAAVWTYDLGNSGFGNNEVETYCGPAGTPNNPASCPTTFSTSTANAYVDGNGHLVMQAINNGGAWTSARMKTQGLQNFQYGRIEASIQLPDTTNQGLWPAFWMLGSDINTMPWPACGETDILEVWSQSVLNGPGPSGNRSTLHTVSTDGDGVQPNGAFTFANAQTNNSAFHTYGMIWSANMQQFYVDNPLQPYYIATTSDLKASDTWPFNLQFFLLLNIAVGGTLGGTPSASTPNPGVLMADYVRQYSGAAAAPTLGNPPGIDVTAGATTGNTSTFTPGLAAGSGFVYFTCDTTAPKATCAISTTDPLNAHVVNSNAAETVTATVTTTANSALAPLAFAEPSHPRYQTIPMFLAFSGMLTILLYQRSRRTGEPARRCVWRFAAGCAVLAATIAGCGGGSTVTPPSDGTTPGVYVVHVYAFTETNSSDGTNAHADAQVTIPLTVN